jgi:hypothetical protein
MSFSCDVLKDVIHRQKVLVDVSHVHRQHCSSISLIVSLSGEYENGIGILRFGTQVSKLCALVFLIDPIVYY